MIIKDERLRRAVEVAQWLAAHVGVLSEEIGRLRALCREHGIEPWEAPLVPAKFPPFLKE